MKNLILTTFLFFGVICAAWTQVNITNVTTSPNNPQQGDTLVIVADAMFNNSNCDLDTIIIQGADSTKWLQAVHCTGPLPTICTAQDTFKIVLDSAWNYSFLIEIYESYDTLCNPYPYPSDTAHVFVSISDSSGTNGIDKLNLDYTIYPNPAKDLIHVDFGGNENLIAEIGFYSIDGKLIHSLTFESKLKIDLPAGIYFVKPKTIVGDQEFPIKRLIIER